MGENKEEEEEEDDISHFRSRNWEILWSPSHEVTLPSATLFNQSLVHSIIWMNSVNFDFLHLLSLWKYTDERVHHNVTHLCPTQHGGPLFTTSTGAHFRETPSCVEKGQQHLFSYVLFLNAGTWSTVAVFLIHTKDYVFWQAGHFNLWTSPHAICSIARS